MNRRVEELFDEVADLSPENRRRYFDEQHIDERTRAEVEALLAFDSGSSEYFRQGVGNAAARAVARLETQELRCGPYRLLELIGQGGMGAVYRAERIDGEVKQQVAVKLLRPGAGDFQQRERFLQERQILASLSHPNVARLLDAGHREDGQPFLAMEFVEGKSIDVFAAQFNVRQKIILFRKVCGAIAYLHRNLVVHRDLKPSNILVTAEGEPKLLDFGIAKILDLASDQTITGMHMLTPDYASPEQVMGRQVSTSTDIYSLGAVLYLLLTGKPPHEFDRERPEAMSAVICEREIARPSKSVPALKGDLDYILMKALHKEPQERYATVEQFAEDLQRCLESRPVHARKGNAIYRARKFARRYWLPVSAAVVMVVGLSVGLFVANRERAIAQRRFLDVRQLANKLFDVDRLAQEVPGSTKVRQLIVDTSLEYLRRLSTESHGDLELALELGNAYEQVARVQGLPNRNNLGQTDQAAQNLQIADGFIQSVLAAQPANRQAVLHAAEIAHDRMILAASQGGRRDGPRAAEALALARTSALWLGKFHAGNADAPGDLDEVLGAYMNVADQFLQARQSDDALRLCREASDIARSINHRAYLGMFLWVTAEVLQQRGDLDEALKTIRESEKLVEPEAGNTDVTQLMQFANVLIWEGRILGLDKGVSLGRSEEAAVPLEHAVQLTDNVVHRDTTDQSSRARMAMAAVPLADVLRYADARRALDVYDHTLRHLAEIQNNAVIKRFEVVALAGSSYALRQLGRPAEARERLDAAFERLKQMKLYPAEKVTPGSVAYKTLWALGDLEAADGNVSRAIEIQEELLEKISAAKIEPDSSLDDATDVSNIYGALTGLYRRNRKLDRAASVSALRLELWRKWDRKLPSNPFVQRQLDSAKF
jgi:tRNA A-37 threonylcarbamoyl transferase component Bud32/tetratricopeptide (TPR) repeat protein